MLIKVQFLRNGEPAGRRYTYKTDLDVAVGDKVLAGHDSIAQVVAVDVPEEEGAAFGDKLKSIDVKFIEDTEKPEDKLIFDEEVPAV